MKFILNGLLFGLALSLYIQPLLKVEQFVDRKEEKNEMVEEIVENMEKDSEEKAEEMIVSVFKQDGSVEKLGLEDYVMHVLPNEMPISFEKEALKAQAIATRTYVLSRQLEVDDSTLSQVFLSDEDLRAKWQGDYEENMALVKAVVDETAGQILTYDGQPITAAFFSSCAGKTNNVEDYWQNYLPYLRSVTSDEDLQAQIYSQLSFTYEQLFDIFHSSIDELYISEWFDSGYVKSVVVDGQVYSGKQIRELLGLPSHAFTIVLSDVVTFQCIGHGHGIGMSQIGANMMAKKGGSAEEILHHYYTDVEIQRVDV